MSAKLNTTEKPVRRDSFELAPGDTIAGRNSRIVDNPNHDADVAALAVSMVQVGQQQPCVGHRNGENKVVIDAGLTRRAAALKIREGFTAVDPTDGETRTFHDPEFRLKVLVDTDKVSEQEALLRSLTENHQRHDTTDLQEALAQQVLREEFQWTDKAIADFYGYTNQNRVMDLKKLANAPEHVQQLVHTNKLALSVYAHDLIDMDAKARDLVIEKCTDDQGRVQGARVRDMLRQIANGDDVETIEPPEPTERKPREKKPAGSKSPGRTLKNLRDFCNSYLQSDDANPGATPVVETLLRWLDGSLKTDRQLLAVLDEISY